MTDKKDGANSVRSNDGLGGQVRMTPEQIQNWRRVLTYMFGPYALIMSDEEVHKFRDNFQSKVDPLAARLTIN